MITPNSTFVINGGSPVSNNIMEFHSNGKLVAYIDRKGNYVTVGTDMQALFSGTYWKVLRQAIKKFTKKPTEYNYMIICDLMNGTCGSIYDRVSTEMAENNQDVQWTYKMADDLLHVVEWTSYINVKYGVVI